MKRVLLDENLPRLLKRELPSYTVRTVQEVGWAGIKNGKLLRLAAGEFDVFLTADQNLEYQQPVAAFGLAIVVLQARTTKLEDLLPLLPDVLAVLSAIESGQVRSIKAT